MYEDEMSEEINRLWKENETLKNTVASFQRHSTWVEPFEFCKDSGCDLCISKGREE